MNPATSSRLTALERAAASSATDQGRANLAIARYLDALELGDSWAGVRPVWGGDAAGAMAIAARVAGPLGATPDVLRPARVREAHVAARLAAWPDGSVESLARAGWTDARDAARAIARNVAWNAATVLWVDTLGDRRFQKGSVEQLLGTQLPNCAIDAQSAALSFAAAAALEDGRDPAWRALHEPLFDAFCAGASRFWLLPGAIVIAPRSFIG